MYVNTMQNKIPPGMGRRESVLQELAKRELARRSYREYLAYAHDGTWKRTRMSSFLADEVQRFIETAGGSAHLRKGVLHMPITLTFHIFGYTVTITVKSKSRHSAK